MASIKAPVGKGGKNDAPDVKKVQALLNSFAAFAKFKMLKVDGIIGPKTEGAILAYQRAMGPPMKVNGLIKPGDLGFVTLNKGSKTALKEKAQIELDDRLAKPAEELNTLVQTADGFLRSLTKLLKIPRKLLDLAAKVIAKLAAFVPTAVHALAMRALKVVDKSAKFVLTQTKKMIGFIKNLITAIRTGMITFVRNVLKNIQTGLRLYLKEVKNLITNIAPIRAFFEQVAKVKDMIAIVLPAVRELGRAIADLSLLKAYLSTVRGLIQKAVKTVTRMMAEVAKVPKELAKAA